MKKKNYIVPSVEEVMLNTPLLRAFEPSVLDDTDSGLQNNAPERQTKAF